MITFSVFIILQLTAQAVTAAPLLLTRGNKADLAPIASAVSTVSSSLNVLDIQIQTLTAGNLQGALAVFNSASQFQQTVTGATAQVNATAGTLSVNDALKLKDNTDALASQVQQTMSDLIAKLPVITSLGVTAQITQFIQSQKTTSTALSNVLLTKIPNAGQKIAQESAQSISSSIDQAIEAYAVAAVTAPTTPPATSSPGQATPATPITGSLGPANSSMVTTLPGPSASAIGAASISVPQPASPSTFNITRRSFATRKD
ncbi:hypothetical protein GQ53DRAFT_837015 [Thozetella sp. PMI_491]|nr:hypothetical protein GQ53DRAFT_837015 [Thozetella sp. PMI_491]